MMGFIMKIKTGISVFAFWIIAWQIFACLINREILLPTPKAVLTELGDIVQTAMFWNIILSSTIRVFFSFAFGCAVGVLLSAVMCVSKTADAVFSPVLAIIKATPVASFIMLALLWLNHSSAPVFIAMLTVIPIISGNVKEGILNTNENLLEMGQMFKFRKIKMLTHIYIPSVFPYFYSACSTSLGMAWKATIAAEVLCIPKNAIGTQLYFSKIYLETPALFAWTALVILMSCIPEFILKIILRKYQKTSK